MNKELIKTKIINLLDERLKNLNDSIKQNKDSMKQAPTPMESHSDTSRFQFGQLVDNFQILAGKIEKVIKEIKENKAITENIEQGSIVQIEKDGSKLYYYIASMGLGESLEIDGKEFRVISIDTPIAQCLLGKKIGDDIEIKTPNGNYFVKIIEIN